MVTLVDDVRNFVNRKVLTSVEYFDKNNIYPKELIEIMKSMGLFGLVIPKVYDGLGVNLLTRLKIIEELSSGWVSLCSILDSHLRVCDYIIQFGTDQQKQLYLPLLAKGKLIAAHANNEKNMKIFDSLETSLTSVNNSLETWNLSGRKEWISNSRNADIFAVSTRIISEHSKLKSINTCVILIEKSTHGLKIGNDWNRMGVKGISLAPVIFDNCLIETKNIIGELRYDGKTLVESSQRTLSMISVARAIGISKRLIEKCARYLLERNRNGIIGSLSEEPVVRMRFAQLIMKFYAAQSLFNDCCSNVNSVDKSKFLACKVFVTETTKKITLLTLQLFGASGYTSEYGIERYIRDSLALTIIHTPTDISLTRLGQISLEHFKNKFQNPSSIVLHYAPRVLPHIKRQYLLQSTLEEQERIVNAGYYRSSNIQIYLYDMTTLNPSGTFKDFIGCLTFAYCLQNNINYICAQSSGNTAMSLIHYARKNPSIKLIQFYLTRNSYKINSSFVPDNVILVEVNSTESEMKRILKRFSDLTGIPSMPNFDLQVYANKIRSYFLTDYCTQNRISFNWYVQALSSGYGPIGLYQGFKDIGEQISVPQFLGIQQQALCPFARALGFWDDTLNINDEQIPLIEPTLFRSDPGELISQMKYILDTYGGKIKVLTNENFNQYLDQSISLLSKNNIHPTKTSDGTLLEKAGILSLAATLHEIDNEGYGVFSPNDNILIGITGGTACPATQKPKPNLILKENPTDEQLKLILEHL